MEFTVHVQGGSKNYSGNATYSIDPHNGVLTVHADDGTSYRYSPAHWELVKDRGDTGDTSVPVIEDVRTL